MEFNLVIRFVFFIQKWQRRLKNKILKFLGIQPVHESIWTEKTDKLKVLTWCLKQNQKVYTLVDQNFSSWDKIFVFSDWSILFLNFGCELDLDERHQFVDRNYYKNSFFQNRIFRKSKSLSVGKNWNEELQKCFWIFTKEETISEEFILILNTFNRKIPWGRRYIQRQWIIGYIHRLCVKMSENYGKILKWVRMS